MEQITEFDDNEFILMDDYEEDFVDYCSSSSFYTTVSEEDQNILNILTDRNMEEDDDDDAVSALTDKAESVPSTSFYQHNILTGESLPSNFTLSYLLNDSFIQNLLKDITEFEKKECLFFYSNLFQTGGCCGSTRALNKIARRTFGKDHFKNSGKTQAQIRDEYNRLDMKFYALTCLYYLRKEPTRYDTTKEQFLEQFGAIINSFKSSCRASKLNLDDDQELIYLYQFLAPLVIFNDNQFNGPFFHRKSGLFLALGQFMESSGRSYTSGGGKTVGTKLREACMDLITGNIRTERKKGSKRKSNAASKKSSGKGNLAEKKPTAAMTTNYRDSDSDSEYGDSVSDYSNNHEEEYKRSLEYSLAY